MLAAVAGCPAPPVGERDIVGFNVTSAAAAASGGAVSGAPAPAPVFASVAIFQSIPGKSGHHAPTITALPDGALLAAWYSYAGPHELDGAAIYLARRPAGGGWTPPALHVDRPAGDGNPVLYSEGERVWLFQAVVPGGWSTSHIEFQIADDAGRTWTPPAGLDARLGSNVRFPPVRLADGTRLLPAYDDLLRRSLFYASADGVRWSLRSELVTPASASNIQPSAAVLDDGRILAVMRNGGGSWLWVTASDDGGHSWLPAADSGFPNPDAPAALLRLRSGNLLLVYNDSIAVRRPLVVALSSDEGGSWHPPREIADGDGAYAYPAAVQSPDGLVHVVYSHNREWIQHVTFNEAWAAGT